MEVEELSVLGRNEGQNLAVDVRRVGSFQFLADVSCHGNDVVHEHFHVGENGVVDMLENIVGGITFGAYLVSCIDESVSERLHFSDMALDFKLVNDVF